MNKSLLITNALVEPTNLITLPNKGQVVGVCHSARLISYNPHRFHSIPNRTGESWAASCLSRSPKLNLLPTHHLGVSRGTSKFLIAASSVLCIDPSGG